jgi:outer membrane receptor protein involved in Fe transport
VVCLASALGGLASLPAHAQAAPPGGGDDVQTVVVTANKRPERQRDVAGTVSVLSGDDLERRGARDQEDTLKLTPGVQVNKGDPSDNLITIRGLGTSACSVCPTATQGTTGLYLEDVPLSEPAGKLLVPDLAPFDLDRVEVLRGPQGALYGSASLGGAVRYLVAKPGLRSLQASVLGGFSRTGGGNGGTAFGMIDAPLADGVAGLRVSAYERKDGGYIDNPGTGRDHSNTYTVTGGRVVGAVKPTTGLDATLVLLTQSSTQDDSFSVGPDPDRLVRSAPTPSTRDARFDFSSLTVNWDVGSHVLTSITGWWRKTLDSRLDTTRIIAASVGAPVTAPVTGDSHLRGSATSQELRLANKGDGPLSYMVGGFTQRSTSEGDQSQDLLAYYGFTFAGDSRQKGRESALFFDTAYAFSPAWSASLGGRWFRTSVESEGSTIVDIPGTGTFTTPAGAPETSDHGFTPKATVKYRFGEHLWYALVSKGFRFGGTNTNTVPPRNYKSDNVWNYETGLRLSPARGLQLDLTAFYIDWKDAQLTYYDATLSPPQGVTGNVGQARSVGAEVAAKWRVAQDFDLAGALAFTDAKTTAAFVSQPVPGQPPITRDAGTRLPGTARVQTALQATYRFGGPWDSAGRATATHTYVGKREADLYGFNQMPGYHTLDLGLEFSRDR